MTDSQLIREIKDGNVQLYSELMRRYQRKILAFIFHMLKGAQLELMAEDLCSESFYKAYRSLHSFREGEASFSTWLYTIARNTVLSELRKQRTGHVSLEESGLMPVASPDSVPEQRLLPSDRQGLGIDTVTTPGHAVHHVCYRSGDYLFAGEAGGVFQEFRGGRDYLRPATPVRFFLETSIASIDRLLDLAPGRICYGHFGMHDQAELQLKAHRSQLLQWADICGERIDRVSPNTFLNDCLELLLAKDPHLASYHRFSEDVQSRERGFLENSLRGFEDYLRKR